MHQADMALAITDLMQEIEELEDLILWLARAYGDNDPIFSYQDPYGAALPENVRLDAIWHRVVRNSGRVVGMQEDPGDLLQGQHKEG